MPADAMPSAIESQFHHQPGIFLRSWSFIESLDLPSACGWVRRSDWVPRHPVAELIFQRPIFFWQFTIQRRQGRGSSFLSFRFFCKKKQSRGMFFLGVGWSWYLRRIGVSVRIFVRCDEFFWGWEIKIFEQGSWVMGPTFKGESNHTNLWVILKVPKNPENNKQCIAWVGVGNIMRPYWDVFELCWRK